MLRSIVCTMASTIAVAAAVCTFLLIAATSSIVVATPARHIILTWLCLTSWLGLTLGFDGFDTRVSVFSIFMPFTVLSLTAGATLLAAT